MVGLAFAVAASANFPALLLALTWRRFNTAGAVTGVLFGVISAIVLVIVSPKVWPGADSETGSPIGWTLANPGIISIPLGFIGCYLGTVLSKEHGAERTLPRAVRPVRDRARRERALVETRNWDNAPAAPAARGRRRVHPTRRGGDAMADGATLESQIDELLDQETLRSAGGRSPSRRWSPTSRCTRRPTTDSEGFWAEQAEALHWFERVGHRCSTSPTRRSTSGSTAASSTSSYNCLDRHVEAGNGDRVAFHWRGEEGEERDVTYADLLRDVQKFANALKDRGVGRATSSGSSCR